MSVATLVEALTQKLKRRQVELKVSAFGNYKELLVAANANEAIDLDEFQLILEANEKTPAQFQADVATYAERVALRARLDTVPVIESQKRAAEAKRDRLLQELTEVENRIRPQVAAALEAIKTAEHQLISVSGIEDKLAGSAMDPGIAAREAELNDQRRTIGAKARELHHQRDQLQKRIGYHQANISGVESQLHQNALGRVADVFTGRQKGERRQAIEGDETAVRQLRNQLEEVNQQLSGLDAETQAIEREASQLRAQRLVP